MNLKCHPQIREQRAFTMENPPEVMKELCMPVPVHFPRIPGRGEKWDREWTDRRALFQELIYNSLDTDVSATAMITKGLSTVWPRVKEIVTVAGHGDKCSIPQRYQVWRWLHNHINRYMKNLKVGELVQREKCPTHRISRDDRGRERNSPGKYPIGTLLDSHVQNFPFCHLHVSDAISPVLRSNSKCHTRWLASNSVLGV